MICSINYKAKSGLITSAPLTMSLILDHCVGEGK